MTQVHDIEMQCSELQVDAGKREIERDINLVRESPPDEEDEIDEQPMEEVQMIAEKVKTKQKQKVKTPAQKAPAAKEKKREKLRIPVERGRQRMVE